LQFLKNTVSKAYEKIWANGKKKEVLIHRFLNGKE
jgi:hypothetical protein